MIIWIPVPVQWYTDCIAGIAQTYRLAENTTPNWRKFERSKLLKVVNIRGYGPQDPLNLHPTVLALSGQAQYAVPGLALSACFTVNFIINFPFEIMFLNLLII